MNRHRRRTYQGLLREGKKALHTKTMKHIEESARNEKNRINTNRLMKKIKELAFAFALKIYKQARTL